jgi:hypothetical protein
LPVEGASDAVDIESPPKGPLLRVQPEHALDKDVQHVQRTVSRHERRGGARIRRRSRAVGTASAGHGLGEALERRAQLVHERRAHVELQKPAPIRLRQVPHATGLEDEHLIPKTTVGHAEGEVEAGRAGGDEAGHGVDAAQLFDERRPRVQASLGSRTHHLGPRPRVSGQFADGPAQIGQGVAADTAVTEPVEVRQAKVARIVTAPE